MMTQQAIYDQIVRILRERLEFEDALRPDMPLAALGLDSIRFMQLIVSLEETLGFSFDLESSLPDLQHAPLERFAGFVHEACSRAA